MRHPLAGPSLVIWGASSHAKVVADAARRSGWSVVGFLDDLRPDLRDSVFCGAKVLGPLEEWLALQAGRTDISLALGVGSNRARVRVLRRMESCAVPLTTVIHPSAEVAASAFVGAGSVIMAGAILQAEAILGQGVIVNTRAGVDHECVVSAGCHVGVNATLAGQVQLGQGVTIGPGAIVCAGRSVGAWTVVGAGAVAVRDLPRDIAAWGTPARPMRALREDE